jgi:hypothetical protein
MRGCVFRTTLAHADGATEVNELHAYRDVPAVKHNRVRIQPRIAAISDCLYFYLSVYLCACLAVWLSVLMSTCVCLCLSVFWPDR